ncbi:MAG: hypothetical protein WCT50_03395 [Patescibacteria group bacterium]
MKKTILLLSICVIILIGAIYILKEKHNREIQVTNYSNSDNSLSNSSGTIPDFQKEEAKNKKVDKDGDNSCEDKIKDFYASYMKSGDYTYTDNTINIFTGEKYAIKKSSNEGCGRNGSLCDLIKEDGENIDIIDNLLFPTCALYSDGTEYLKIMNNAELLEFVDKDNLLISFGEYDHCVNDASIANYNLKTKKLTNNLLSFSHMEKSCWDKGYVPYDICKLTSCLTFTDGITFKKDEEIINVKNNIEYPYDVVFDVKTNYKNTETISLLINKEAYIFNFNTGSLIRGN